MRIIWGTSQTPEVNSFFKAWAENILWDGKRQFGPCITMGVFDGPRLIGVMVYHEYDPDRQIMEISGASIDKRWLTRRTLKAMFDYPLAELGLQMVVMRVSERDRPLHRMLSAYGFSSIHIPRLRGRDEGENIFTLTDDAWRTNRFNSRCNSDEQTRHEAA